MTVISELNSFKRKYGSGWLRAFVTGTDNFLTYFFGKMPSRGPLYLGWDVTFRCNFKCGYCSVDKMVDAGKKELSTEECINLVRDAGKAGVWILGITGGEPLLRPDLPIIIKEAKKAGLNVNINTNASMLKRKAQELVDSGLDAITVSVESHNAEIHNEIRAFQQSFQLILEGIAELKRLRTGRKPYIMVRTIITKRNYRILDEFIGYWKQYADDIIIQPLHDGYASSFFIPHNNALRFSSNDEEEFREYYATMVKKHKFLNNAYYTGIPDFLFKPNEQRQRYHCFVSFFELQLDAYGDIVSCSEFIKKFGNIREKGLMDIWSHSQEIQQFRETISQGKQGCWCWYTCTGPFHVYGTKIAKFFRKM